MKKFNYETRLRYTINRLGQDIQLIYKLYRRIERLSIKISSRFVRRLILYGDITLIKNLFGCKNSIENFRKSGIRDAL